MSKRMTYRQLYWLFRTRVGTLVGGIAQAYRIPPAIPERNIWDSPYVNDIWLETKSETPREYHPNGSIVLFLNEPFPTLNIQYAHVMLGEKAGKIMLNDLRFQVDTSQFHSRNKV
jgi:hypothetical protein